MTEIVTVDGMPLLDGSPKGVWAEGFDIDYGGVDEDGELVPAARRTGVWADWDF